MQLALTETNVCEVCANNARSATWMPQTNCIQAYRRGCTFCGRGITSVRVVVLYKGEHVWVFREIKAIKGQNVIKQPKLALFNLYSGDNMDLHYKHIGQLLLAARLTIANY